MCITVLECLSEIKHGGVTLIGKTRGDLFFEKRLSKTYINSADLQMNYVKFDIHILLTWNCFYNIYKYNNPKQY